MSNPQVKEKTQTRERPTFSDKVLSDFQETHKRLDRIENRMDKLEARMDRLEVRMEMRMDNLERKMDALHNEIKSSTNHGQIATISTIGIAIAVIYSLLR